MAESEATHIIPLNAVSLDFDGEVATVSIVVDGQIYQIMQHRMNQPFSHTVPFWGLHAIIHGPDAVPHGSELSDDDDVDGRWVSRAIEGSSDA